MKEELKTIFQYKQYSDKSKWYLPFCCISSDTFWKAKGARAKKNGKKNIQEIKNQSTKIEKNLIRIKMQNRVDSDRHVIDG